MKELIHKYLQVGTVQWVSYPQRDSMESLEVICKDDFFDTIELKGYGNRNEEVEKLLEQSHPRVCYSAQPHLLGGKLNPSDLDGEGRRKAEATLIEAIDEAEYPGAKGIAFLAGRRQSETKDRTYTQFLKTMRAVCDYAVTKGVVAELGVFDYNMDKVAPIGPAPHAAKLAADMRTIHSSFGLLVNLGHFPATYEASRFVIRTPRPYVTRFHLGSVAITKGYDGYGDLHSRFGYPNNTNGTPQLPGYLRVMKEGGFFDAENPYILSMEVTLRPGKNEDIVLTNIKKVLNRTWTLLEDNA